MYVYTYTYIYSIAYLHTHVSFSAILLHGVSRPEIGHNFGVGSALVRLSPSGNWAWYPSVAGCGWICRDI